jgi:hypothetical protein
VSDEIAVRSHFKNVSSELCNRIHGSTLGEDRLAEFRDGTVALFGNTLELRGGANAIVPAENRLKRRRPDPKRGTHTTEEVAVAVEEPWISIRGQCEARDAGTDY